MEIIAENLQIIKNSIDSIKQAIIDKGGEISGDITTWADAIDRISTDGGDSTEQVIFNCRVNDYGNLIGSLNYLPEGYSMICIVYWVPDFYQMYSIRLNIYDANDITISINLKDYAIYKAFLIKRDNVEEIIGGIVDRTQESIPVKLNFI